MCLLYFFAADCLVILVFSAKQGSFMSHLKANFNSPTKPISYPNLDVFLGGQSSKGYSCDPYLELIWISSKGYLTVPARSNLCFLILILILYSSEYPARVIWLWPPAAISQFCHCLCLCLCLVHRICHIQQGLSDCARLNVLKGLSDYGRQQSQSLFSFPDIFCCCSFHSWTVAHSFNFSSTIKT